MLGLVRSMKNTFAPVNRIPLGVLSLIPDHLKNEDLDNRDAQLITLTHICHAWRGVFVSRCSLWTSLNCLDPHKTLTYIERSTPLPLEIRLDDKSRRGDALPLVLPHIGRLGPLTVHGSVDTTPDFIRHFSQSAPLLWKLVIRLPVGHNQLPAFPSTLFNRELSSVEPGRSHTPRT